MPRWQLKARLAPTELVRVKGYRSGTQEYLSYLAKTWEGYYRRDRNVTTQGLKKAKIYTLEVFSLLVFQIDCERPWVLPNSLRFASGKLSVSRG